MLFITLNNKILKKLPDYLFIPCQALSSFKTRDS